MNRKRIFIGLACSLIVLAVLVFFTSLFKNMLSQKVEPIIIHRYERALLTLNQDSLAQGLASLETEFPFYLKGADFTDTMNLQQMRLYFQDPVIKDCYQKSEQVFGDMLPESKVLAQEFFAIKSNIANFEYPRVYTYFSYFDYPNRIFYDGDSVLSIGLDLYLGADLPYYRSVGLPAYRSEKCQRKNLPIDIAYTIATAYQKDVKPKTLLDNMIASGKIIYLVDKALPDVSLEDKLYYNKAQSLWIESNKLQVWRYFAREKLLFCEDPNKIACFINDGPGNMGFDGAPPRLASYFGYMIVRDYMENEKKSYQDLLSIPTLEVLKKSRFKP